MYKKMQEEYFDTNNISFYGRNKDSIFNIVFLLAVILVARTILKTLFIFANKIIVGADRPLQIGFVFVRLLQERQ